MNQAIRLLGCALLLPVTAGCRNLDRFDTQPGESYCGSLVGQETIATGFHSNWEGSRDISTLSLKLNTAAFFEKSGVPAVISSNDAAFGPCGPNQPLFVQAPMRTIGAALGDRLSTLRLGEDHQLDFTTYVESTCSGSMVGILSLLQSGDVELRLLRPAPMADGDDAATADTTARFGLFVLKKTKEGCGF
jgi:hypothetical protein